jgi:hypothetical protein
MKSSSNRVFAVSIPSLASAASLYATNALSDVRSSRSLASSVATATAGKESTSTRVSLSRQGAQQLAQARVADAANRLNGSTRNENVTGLTRALQGTIDAVNARSAVGGVLPGDGKTSASQAAAGQSQSARTNTGATSANTLSSLGVSDGTRKAMQNIGVSTNANGQLKLDTQTFQNAVNTNPQAVRQTLGDFAQQLATASANAIVAPATTYTVAATANSQGSQSGGQDLSQDNSATARQVQSQQAQRMQELLQAPMRQMEQAGFVFTGAAAYNRIFASS